MIVWLACECTVSYGAEPEVAAGIGQFLRRIHNGLAKVAQAIAKQIGQLLVGQPNLKSYF